MAGQFSKPRDGNPTRHLFVGNCGACLGVQENDILAAFGDYGTVELTTPDPAKSHIFVSYATVENAVSALQALGGRPCERLGNRVLVVKYADFRRPPRPQAEEIPILSTSSECGIDGLLLIRDFITDEEEKALLDAWDKEEGIESHGGRNVKHFGVRFDYATRNVDREHPLDDFPVALLPIVQRIEAIDGVPPLDQLTVNDYPSGVGLAPHIDTHSAFTGAIISLSTGAEGVMEFRRDGDRRRIGLPRRSLLVMNGESRYCWQHYIPHRRNPSSSTHRVSFTLRQARGFPCDCEYPQYCDSQDGVLPPTRLALLEQTEQSAGSAPASEPAPDGATESVAQPSSSLTPLGMDGNGSMDPQILEDQYVHKVYDVIARHFSATRFAVWPKVREFLDRLPSGALLADVGCGNGKYFAVRKDVVTTGLDRSKGLVEVALSKVYPVGLPTKGRPVVDVGVADALRLPLRAESYDGVLCIAVLHHISNLDRRKGILEEIARVLTSGGRGLITVWAEEQENPEKTLAKWTPIGNDVDPGCNCKPLDSNGEGRVGGDYFVPWHLPLHRAEGQQAAERVRGNADSAKEKTSGKNLESGWEGGNGESLEEWANVGRLDEKKRSIVFQRFYHLFIKGELERLCQQTKGLEVVESFFDKSNWCVVVKKAKC